MLYIVIACSKNLITTQFHNVAFNIYALLKATFPVELRRRKKKRKTKEFHYSVQYRPIYTIFNKLTKAILLIQLLPLDVVI